MSSSPETEKNGVPLSFDKTLADAINRAGPRGLPVVLTGNRFCGKSLAMDRLRAQGSIPSDCKLFELSKQPLDWSEKGDLKKVVGEAKGVVEGSPYHFQYLAAPPKEVSRSLFKNVMGTEEGLLERMIGTFRNAAQAPDVPDYLPKVCERVEARLNGDDVDHLFAYCAGRIEAKHSGDVRFSVGELSKVGCKELYLSLASWKSTSGGHGKGGATLIIPLLERVMEVHAGKDRAELLALEKEERKREEVMVAMFGLAALEVGGLAANVVEKIGPLLLPALAASPVLPVVAAAGLAILGATSLVSFYERRKVMGFDRYIELRKKWSDLAWADEKRQIIATELDEKSGVEPGSSYEFLERWLGQPEETFEKQLERFFPEDTRKMIKEVVEESPGLKNKVTGLQRQLDDLKGEVEEGRGIYRDPGKLGVEKRGSDYFFGIHHEYQIVGGEGYERIAERISRLLAEGKRVALTGSHGIGKSLLARYALAREGEPVVAVQEVDRVKLRRTLEESSGMHPTLFFDPSGPEVYYSESSTGTAFEALKESVRDVLEDVIGVNLPTLVVLPSDIWESGAIGDDLRNAFEQVSPSHELSSREFLRAVVLEHAGTKDVPGDLEGLLNETQYGGALLVAYCGRWLKQNGLQIKDVHAAVRDAKGNPIHFFQDFVMKVILKDDWDTCQSFSLPLLVHDEFGEISSGLARTLPLAVESGHLRELNPFAADWISQVHEDLMEEALRKLVREPNSKLLISRALDSLFERADGLSSISSRGGLENREISRDGLAILIRKFYFSGKRHAGDSVSIMELYTRVVLSEVGFEPLFAKASQNVRNFFFTDRSHRFTRLGRAMLLGEWSPPEVATEGAPGEYKEPLNQACSVLAEEVGKITPEGLREVGRELTWVTSIAYGTDDVPTDCLCLALAVATTSLYALIGSSPESERVHRGIGMRLAQKVQTDHEDQARCLSRYYLELSMSGVWGNRIWPGDYVHLQSLLEKSSDWITRQNLFQTFLNCWTMTAEPDLKEELSRHIFDLTNLHFSSLVDTPLDENLKGILADLSIGPSVVRFLDSKMTELENQMPYRPEAWQKDRREAFTSYGEAKSVVVRLLPEAVSIGRRLGPHSGKVAHFHLDSWNQDVLPWLRNEFPLAPEENLERIFSRWLDRRDIAIISYQASSIELDSESDAIKHKTFFEDLSARIEKLEGRETENSIYSKQVALLDGYLAGDMQSLPTLTPMRLESIEEGENSSKGYTLHHFPPEFFGFATACHLIFANSLNSDQVKEVLGRYKDALHRLPMLSALTYGVLTLRGLYKDGAVDQMERAMFDGFMGGVAYARLNKDFGPCLRLVMGDYYQSLPHGTMFYLHSLFPATYEEAMRECIKQNMPARALAMSRTEQGVRLVRLDDGRVLLPLEDDKYLPLDMTKISLCEKAIESYRSGHLKTFIMEHVVFGSPESARSLLDLLDDRTALMMVPLIQTYDGLILLIVQLLLDGKPELVHKICMDSRTEIAQRHTLGLREAILLNLGEAAREGNHDATLQSLLRLCSIELRLPVLQ